MRVLYGCNAQGQGHLSKAAVLVPIMQAAGHEVRVVTSGLDIPQGYSFPGHRHFAGLPFSTGGGRTVIGSTLKSWARRTPGVLRGLAAVRGIVRDWPPDLIISDFELLTASPAVGADCEVVSLCRQVALFDPGVPMPAEEAVADAAGQRKLTKAVVRLFTLGADRYAGYHYAPSSPRCVPPVIRPELARLLEQGRPPRGEMLLTYNQWAKPEDTADLLRWAKRTQTPVNAYGHFQHPRGRFGTVTFREPSRETMLADLASCRCVLTTAGLTTPAEAFLLGKPCGVIPLPGQWEQAVNAVHLSDAGVATAFDRWDYDAAMELRPPQADSTSARWLQTPPQTILEQVREGLGIGAEGRGDG